MCSASRCDCSPVLWLWPPPLTLVAAYAQDTGFAVVSVGLWSPLLVSDVLDPSTATVSHITVSKVAWCFTYIAITFLFSLAGCTWHRTVDLDLPLNGSTPFPKEVEQDLCAVKTLAFCGNLCRTALPLMSKWAYLFAKDVHCPDFLLQLWV